MGIDWAGGGTETPRVYDQLIPLLSIHVQTKRVRRCSAASTVVLIQCGPDNHLPMYHPRGSALPRRYFFCKHRRDSPVQQRVHRTGNDKRQLRRSGRERERKKKSVWMKEYKQVVETGEGTVWDNSSASNESFVPYGRTASSYFITGDLKSTFWPLKYINTDMHVLHPEHRGSARGDLSKCRVTHVGNGNNILRERERGAGRDGGRWYPEKPVYKATQLQQRLHLLSQRHTHAQIPHRRTTAFPTRFALLPPGRKPEGPLVKILHPN